MQKILSLDLVPRHTLKILQSFFFTSTETMVCFDPFSKLNFRPDMRENIKLTSSFISEQYSTCLLSPLSTKALPCWTQNGHSITKESRVVLSSSVWYPKHSKNNLRRVTNKRLLSGREF